MSTLLTFDDIRKIEALNGRENNNGDGFGFGTCCDYVDSLVYDGDRRDSFGVVMFVEPRGNITKWGDSFSSVLDWWIWVFELQPAVWDYMDAGHWLMDLFEDDKLSDAPGNIWPSNVGKVLGVIDAPKVDGD